MRPVREGENGQQRLLSLAMVAVSLVFSVAYLSCQPSLTSIDLEAKSGAPPRQLEQKETTLHTGKDEEFLPLTRRHDERPRDDYEPYAYEPLFDIQEADEFLLPLAEITGNNGEPETAFPLQRCQGDCDFDAECDWGLVCHQRERTEDDIPGCDVVGDGDYVGDNDFCVSSDKILPDAFRLKMYWEDGYEWQNSTEEMWYCMTTHYEGYFDGPCCRGLCWYGEDPLPCRRDQVYIERCLGAPGDEASFPLSSEQQAFRFLKVPDLEDPFGDPVMVSRRFQNVSDPEEVLIQSAFVEDQRCLERLKREVYLAQCDYNNPNQRWSASNGTDFFDATDNRFEISQQGFTRQCLANAHHPKPGEVIEMHSCRALRAEDSQTAYWSRY